MGYMKTNEELSIITCKYWISCWVQKDHWV